MVSRGSGYMDRGLWSGSAVELAAMIRARAANYLSLPAGVVPIGFADGRPAGVQIIGRRFREDLILDAMEVIESSVGILAHTLWEREGQVAG